MKEVSDIEGDIRELRESLKEATSDVQRVIAESELDIDMLQQRVLRGEARLRRIDMRRRDVIDERGDGLRIYNLDARRLTREKLDEFRELERQLRWIGVERHEMLGALGALDDLLSAARRMVDSGHRGLEEIRLRLEQLNGLESVLPGEIAEAERKWEMFAYMASETVRGSVVRARTMAESGERMQAGEVRPGMWVLESKLVEGQFDFEIMYNGLYPVFIVQRSAMPAHFRLSDWEHRHTFLAYGMCVSADGSRRLGIGRVQENVLFRMLESVPRVIGSDYGSDDGNDDTGSDDGSNDNVSVWSDA
jgi:hypothetical protein